MVGFVGVNHERSSTVEYIRDVLSFVSDKIDIDIELYTQANSQLRMCKGCCTCFNRHYCPLDSLDHMDIIKEKMLNADFLIFGSPVYMHSVSGCMKNFFDRISYWSHLMPLRGKNCMLISSADSNGGNLTTNYMEKITSYLGCPAVVRANIFGVNGYDDGKKKIHADTLVECIDHPIKSNAQIEKIYLALNMVMNSRVALEGNVEYEYWKKNGMLNAESFESLI